MNELELEKDMIKRLRTVQDVVNRHTEDKEPISELFIRGFIMGAEGALGLKIASHRFGGIVQAVRS